MPDIVEKILLKLDLDGNFQYKKAIRGYDGFSIKEAITAIIYTDSIVEASELLGYTSVGPIKNFTRDILIPKFPKRSKNFGTGIGSSSWRFDLLELIEFKHCCTCDKLLSFDNFGVHKGNDKTGLAGQCLSCKVFISKQYKLDIKIRTPNWANISKIYDIYLNCPKGHHVDHIVPLKGSNVCGLHVENNLQYLTAEDNQKKNNKWG